MARKKKLNLDNLLNDNKLYEKNQPIQVDDKNTLYYSQAIGHDKIDKLITELSETVEYAKKNGFDYPSTDAHLIEYLQYLAFKYFTNLEEAMEGRGYEDNIVAFRNAYKYGWMTKVIGELDLNEFGKVFDRFYETIENTARIADLQKKANEELSNTVKNKEALNAYTARNVVN